MGICILHIAGLPISLPRHTNKCKEKLILDMLHRCTIRKFRWIL